MGSPGVQSDAATASKGPRTLQLGPKSRLPPREHRGRSLVAVRSGHSAQRVTLVAGWRRRRRRRPGKQAGAAQPGTPHHAQAARCRDGRLRRAGLSQHPGQRRRRDRQDVTRHLLSVLLQQGGPAPRARDRGGRRSPESLRRAEHAARRWRQAAMGGRASLGHCVLGAVAALRAAVPRLDRPDGHRP